MRSIAARCHVALIALFVLFAVTGPGVSAQEKPKISKKEADAANKVQEGKDVAAKVKLGEKFVKDFPDSPVRDQVVRYLAEQVGNVNDDAQKSALIDSYLKVFTKAGEADFIAPYQIDLLTKNKQFDEVFKLGGEYLSRKPGNLLVALNLVLTGTNLARTNNKAYAAKCRDIAQKAIDIIEGGKKPEELTDAEWTQAQGSWYARFYQSMGFLYGADGYDAEALASFDKATKLDPTDVSSWIMTGFIINVSYQDIAKKYQAARGAEQAALKKQAEAELDRVIQIYARVVAMTDGVAAQSALNEQVRGDLEMYFKYRNGGKTDGMQALIDKYKTSK